ncbi:MAG: hypothetical protein IPJ69_05920 [Deltaproteobacteria bacterium]|nr:MAG: hypothetical protein IPJ69_05920 [Deltaproteobacteria bacterium]
MTALTPLQFLVSDKHISETHKNPFSMLDATGLNVNQWADLGRVVDSQGKLFDTSLNHADQDREEHLSRFLGNLSSDVFLGTEFFDVKVAKRLWEKHQKKFPYAVIAPGGGGIPEIIKTIQSRYPSVFSVVGRDPQNIVRLVNAITTSHYGTGESLGDVALDILRPEYPKIAKYLEERSKNPSPSEISAALAMEAGAHHTFFDENLQFRLFKMGLGGICPWESGLAIFSRYPLLQKETVFIPHPEVADLEHFTNKGLLKTVVCLPDGKCVTLIVSHFQEGVSPQALRARLKQAIQVRRIADKSPYPVLMIVDYNDIEGSPSYNKLLDESLYRDLYRTLHQDDGFTYDPHDPRNLIAVTKGAANSQISSEKPSRIDFGFSDLNPMVCCAREYYDITDHKALHMIVGLEHYQKLIKMRPW